MAWRGKKNIPEAVHARLGVLDVEMLTEMVTTPLAGTGSSGGR